MNTTPDLAIAPANAICYSGFRQGQMPGGVYPSYEEVKADLHLLSPYWNYLRLYDVDAHCETVLEVIRQENLDFKVLLGAFIEAEMNNPNCPWGGGMYTEEQLLLNRENNVAKTQKLAKIANQYPNIIRSLSVGNEACVDWTDHLVSVDHVLEYADMVKEKVEQQVTYCDNYVPWLNKLKPLAETLDYISIHTYPVWEQKSIREALAYTKANYYDVARLHPGKPVVITEAGWATKSNGRGIPPEHANEKNQKIYFEELMNWTDKEDILVFFFEAFDESWKGSPDPLEPEKHWGIFNVDRTPKKVQSAVQKRVGK